MRVLLLKDVPGLGKRGEIKETSDGYASNFLMPKGLVAPASKQIQNKIEAEIKHGQEKQKHDQERLQSFAKELEKRTFTVKAKVGEQGKLFGAVREKDVATAITNKLGREVDKSSIILKDQIRTVGEFPIEVKLTHGIVANTKIKVEPL